MPLTISGSLNHRPWSIQIERVAAQRTTVVRSTGRSSLAFPIRDIDLQNAGDPWRKRTLISRAIGQVVVGNRESYNWEDGTLHPVTFANLATVSKARIYSAILDMVGGSVVESPYVVDCDCDRCTVGEEHREECAECGVLSRWIEPLAVTGLESPILLCESCRAENYYWCGDHSGFIDHRETQWDYDNEVCEPCRNARPPQVINEWNYRPELVFNPMPPVGEHPLYIGMELEISFLDIRKGREWAGTHLPEYENLLYAKQDGSVNHGFEVVTHPMQPTWAMENFPFHIFQKAMEGWTAKPTDGSTGTHVHMNKDAFSPSVLWKFLQIHMKLPDFCGIVGGRGTDSSYGSFTRNRGNFLGVNAQQLMEIAKKKGKFDNPERYIAVNLRNEYTLELRYMRGGITPSEIKKNIQWAKALYDFATYLDIRDVREGALANPGYLLGFIHDHEDEFPDLVKWISKEVPRPISLRERT